MQNKELNKLLKLCARQLLKFHSPSPLYFSWLLLDWWQVKRTAHWLDELCIIHKLQKHWRKNTFTVITTGFEHDCNSKNTNHWETMVKKYFIFSSSIPKIDWRHEPITPFWEVHYKTCRPKTFYWCSRYPMCHTFCIIFKHTENYFQVSMTQYLQRSSCYTPISVAPSLYFNGHFLDANFFIIVKTTTSQPI